MSKNQNHEAELNEAAESVNTETSRIADEFKAMAETLPSEGGMDAKQTASLKQWLGTHEAVLRKTGVDPEAPAKPPVARPSVKPDPDAKK